MDAPATLVGPRLRLERMFEEDADVVTEALNRNRKHLLPWMPWALELPQGRDKTVEFLERCRREWEAGEAVHYAVREVGAEALIGGVGAHRRVGAGGIEVGYWLDAGCCGRGLATEAAALVVAACFRFLGVMRVEIHVDPRNEPSLAVAQRLGFEREGLLRARFPWPDGSWRDKVVTSLLASEFAGSPAARVELHAFDAHGVELTPAEPKAEVRS